MVEFRVLKGEYTVVYRKDGEEILKPPSWQNSEANKHLFGWTSYDTNVFRSKTSGLVSQDFHFDSVGHWVLFANTNQILHPLIPVCASTTSSLGTLSTL